MLVCLNLKCYIKVNGWVGKNQEEVATRFAKLFRIAKEEAASVVQQVSEGNPWQFQNALSHQQGDQAYSYLKKLGFDLELIPDEDVPSPPGPQEESDNTGFLKSSTIMKCPKCISLSLQPQVTRKGIEVDYCLKCHGIWLDEGEIFYFTKKPNVLNEGLQKAIASSKPTDRLSPKAQEPLHAISVLDGKLLLNYCPKNARGLA